MSQPDNPPVHCIHCGAQQDWTHSLWSLGAEHRRASFLCPSCGWFVQIDAHASMFDAMHDAGQTPFDRREGLSP